MLSRIIPYLSAFLILSFSACDPASLVETPQPDIVIPDDSLGSDKIESIAPACYKETFKQPDALRTNKLDLLFVIDTSGSMNFDRIHAAQRIDRYIKRLPHNTHYRIAVLLAHGHRSRWSGKLYYTGKITPTVFDSKKHPDFWIRLNLQLRLQITPWDYWADGGETSFYSLHKLLEAPQLAEVQKHGFMRPDAALSVLFISDENEICANTPADVIKAPDFDRHKGKSLELIAREENCTVKDKDGNDQWLSPSYIYDRLKEVKGSQPVSIGAIVHTDKNHKGKHKIDESGHGYGYMELVDIADGVAIDIRDKDYREGLERLGDVTSRSMTLYDKFLLTHNKVKRSSIEVSVDHSSRNDFRFRRKTNTVFVADPGKSKSIVEISYCTKSDIKDEDDGDDYPPDDDNGNGGGDDDDGSGDDDNDGGDDGGDDDSDDGSDDGDDDDSGDIPPGCTAVECPDIGI